MSAHDVAATYDCSAYGCTGTARTNRGRYALLCDDHIRERVRKDRAARGTARDEQPAPAPARPVVAAVPSAGKNETVGFVSQLKELERLGKAADREQARYERALAAAREAKRVAERARDEFRAALRKAADG